MPNHIKEIKMDNNLWVKVIGKDKGMIQEQSVDTILLFKILEKLEEIRCGLIDVETAIEKQANK
jgi:hypothetical protein